MSLFGDFPPIADAGSMPAASPPTGGIRVDLPQGNYIYGAFQFLTVQFEENNRQLQEINRTLEKSCKKKKGKHKKSFFEKVGDAFCKALPTILTTVTTAAVGVFFKASSNKKALQAA